MRNAGDAAENLVEGLQEAANQTASLKTATGRHHFSLAVYAERPEDLDSTVADASKIVSHFGGGAPIREMNFWSFPTAETRRLVERFEWHHTPKHGSWLNMAETELSVVSSQCLDRRIASKQRLIDELTAWEVARNNHHAKADCQFTTADARVKLKRLYPSI
jgi:hypothetical protein